MTSCREQPVIPPLLLFYTTYRIPGSYEAVPQPLLNVEALRLLYLLLSIDHDNRLLMPISSQLTNVRVRYETQQH